MPCRGGQLGSSGSLVSRNFVLVCTAHLTGYVGNWMVLPVLPLFLVAEGYSEAFIGLVIAAYNVSSFAARPLFGRLVDTGRPRSALIGSCALLGATTFGYLVPSTAFLFAVRAAHGLGWAGLNAVGTAWIAMLAPVTRRAEAMGFYTMSQSLGTAVGPAIGIGLLSNFGAGVAFTVSALFGVAAFGSSVLTHAPPPLAAPKPKPAAQAGSAGQPWFAGMVEPGIFTATLILTLVQINQPMISSFAPLYFRSIGVSGVEWYFAGQGVMSIVSRALLGSWADRNGRTRSLVLGFGVQMIGLITLWQSSELVLLTLGGALYTLGAGVAQPTLYALAADRAAPARRGAAMATYTMGFQLGSGVGAVFWGSTIQSFGYHVMYGWTFVPLLAAVALALFDRGGRAAEASTA
jgi:MFS family permease